MTLYIVWLAADLESVKHQDKIWGVPICNCNLMYIQNVCFGPGKNMLQTSRCSQIFLVLH